MDKLIGYLTLPWSFSRILRLVMGLYIAIISFNEGNYAFVAIGAFFMYQAIFNVGCNSCQIPAKPEDNEQ